MKDAMRCRFALLLILAFGFALATTSARPQDPAQKPQDPKQKPEAEPQAQEETITFDTNLVMLNVTITDGKDRYVPGLKREDFSIFEDKSQQKIVNFSYDENPFTVAILLDISLSMQNKLSLARAACANFVSGLRDGDTFAIYSFGGMKVKTLQDFTEVRDVPDSVWDMKADGETPLYDGIAKAADALGKRPERRRAILIITDGADTKSKASLDQALRKTLAAQGSIYAVDMTDTTVYGTLARDNGADIMKELTAKTGGKFFRTPGGSKLRDAFASTIEELRHQYTLTYESSNERFDGRWRVVEVKLAKPQFNVRTRQGYYARKNRG
ncbi:MAG: VWA domain-containing protein [Acidobacteriota bacterium]